MAFSQAIELEGDQPGRYIAYAKALEKIGERHKAASALMNYRQQKNKPLRRPPSQNVASLSASLKRQNRQKSARLKRLLMTSKPKSEK